MSDPVTNQGTTANPVITQATWSPAEVTKVITSVITTLAMVGGLATLWGGTLKVNDSAPKPPVVVPVQTSPVNVPAAVPPAVVAPATADDIKKLVERLDAIDKALIELKPVRE